MYKDADKQKEANRLANKRYRDKAKGITTQGEPEGITDDIPKNSDTQRDTAYKDGPGSTNSEPMVSQHPDKVEQAITVTEDTCPHCQAPRNVNVDPGYWKYKCECYTIKVEQAWTPDEIKIDYDYSQPSRTRTEGSRVAIPGDEDYSGICKQIDGRWIADKTDPPAVKDLPRAELYQAIRSYPHDQWINSPEHKELLRRLHTMTIDQLEAEGYWTPAGKISA